MSAVGALIKAGAKLMAREFATPETKSTEEKKP